MSKIIKPFGRRAVTITLTLDDKGLGQLQGSRSVMINGHFRDVTMNIVEVCAILSQTVGSTLIGMLSGVAPGPQKVEVTDGKTDDNAGY